MISALTRSPRAPRSRPSSPPLRFLLCLVVLLAAPDAWAAQDTWSGVERIVAVGDVHGDYEQFVKLLRGAGLLDEKDNWAGGKAHLVQTGDVPDRGARSRDVMDLLMKLEKQAKRAGGYVHALIGNHEAMNMYGDLRYVHVGEFAAFRTKKSKALRDNFYQQHVEELRQNSPFGGPQEIDPDYKRHWLEKFPLGSFEHRLGFSKKGKYGRWITRHNAVVKINGTLFLHGGIGPTYASMSLRELNDQIRNELKGLSDIQLAVDSEGPLWYRGFALHNAGPESLHLENVLATHGAERIVMGHTVTEGAVMTRFDGRAVFIDVGLGSYYGRRMTCLLLEDGQAFALHRNRKVRLPDTDSEVRVLEYLKQAADLDPEPSPLEAKIASIESTLQTAGGP